MKRKSAGEGSPGIPDRLYFRIGDVAEILEVKPYVLRYWETEFPAVAPQKSSSGQRVYRKSDVETLVLIKHLLYQERYSIEGARRRINELRREGELKEFKQQVVEAVAAPQAVEVPAPGVEEAALSAEIRSRMRDLAEDFMRLADAPIDGFFKY